MDYTKQSLTFEQQADLLIKRGLIISHRDELIERLRNVNYTRLSAYWHTFQDPNQSDKFIPGTHFETIWKRYIFDHELRLVVMDAIGHIEVAILRTRMVEQFTMKYGAFGYAKKDNFGMHFDEENFIKMMNETERLTKEKIDKGDEGVKDYFIKYANEKHLPLWMLVEILSFGTLITFFKNMEDVDKKLISKQFGVFDGVLKSWLFSINYVRNLCAHHDRLWNRELSIKPVLPKKDARWTSLIADDNNRVFVVLTILNYLTKNIDPKSNWAGRLKNLLSLYPEIPINPMMGFPENWLDSPLWM